MFSLIRLSKVEGQRWSQGDIHHRQGGKLLQLLRMKRVKGIIEVTVATDEERGPNLRRAQAVRRER